MSHALSCLAAVVLFLALGLLSYGLDAPVSAADSVVVEAVDAAPVAAPATAASDLDLAMIAPF